MNSPDSGQQQANEEFQQLTILALKSAKAGILTDDELSLLCWHCGVRVEEVIKQGDEG